MFCPNSDILNILGAILSKGTYYLSELTVQIGQFVDDVHHFDGLVRTVFYKGAFCLQTDWSGRPVLTNGNYSK